MARDVSGSPWSTLLTCSKLPPCALLCCLRTRGQDVPLGLVPMETPVGVASTRVVSFSGALPQAWCFLPYQEGPTAPTRSASSHEFLCWGHKVASARLLRAPLLAGFLPAALILWALCWPKSFSLFLKQPARDISCHHTCSRKADRPAHWACHGCAPGLVPALETDGEEPVGGGRVEVRPGGRTARGWGWLRPCTGISPAPVIF